MNMKNDPSKVDCMAKNYDSFNHDPTAQNQKPRTSGRRKTEQDYRQQENAYFNENTRYTFGSYGNYGNLSQAPPQPKPPKPQKKPAPQKTQNSAWNVNVNYATRLGNMGAMGLLPNNN